MKITKNQLKEIIRQSILEAWPPKKDSEDKKPEQPSKIKTDIMDNPYDDKEKEDMEEGGKGSGRPKDSDEMGKNLAQMGGDDEDSMDDLMKQMGEGGKGSGKPKGGKKKKPSLGTSIASKVQKQIDKYNKAKKKPTYHHKGDDKLVSLKVRESNGRKCTVKEIKQWFKSLEENRYKKTYNSDARRVSWMVNNSLSEDYESMPISMKKKWPKAAYKRERYLAKEYTKHLKQSQLSELKLRRTIRNIIKEVKNGKKK